MDFWCITVAGRGDWAERKAAKASSLVRAMPSLMAAVIACLTLQQSGQSQTQEQ